MGGDDSQKLLPWRGAYSPPGRSKPPAHGKINTLSLDVRTPREIVRCQLGGGGPPP